MSVLDSARVAVHRANAAREREAQRLRDWVSQQYSYTLYLDNNDLSPANAERQMGRAMTSADLEVRLKKLVPNLHFERNPANATKKAVYLIHPSGKKEFICAYENGFMPEHSVMRTKEEDLPDPSYPAPGIMHHVERKDLPRHEFVPGEGYKFDGVQPGFKRLRMVWGEAKRGWRTVLIKLVLRGLTTPAAVEAIFGSDDRPEWAGHMGKRPVTTPW